MSIEAKIGVFVILSLMLVVGVAVDHIIAVQKSGQGKR